MKQPDYAEFNDPRLASLYDVLFPMGADRDFFLSEVDRLAPQSIIDLGCGTGAMTCSLAERGYGMIGVEPAKPMLDIARSRPCSGSVEWREGSAERLQGLHADLLLMTAHVAQFFLDDDEWQGMLEAAYRALRPGGCIMFDSRNPLLKPWERYTEEATRRSVKTPSDGRVTFWIETVDVDGNRAVHDIHYLFQATGEELISTNELVYRSRRDLTASLERAGFAIDRIYGDWDRGPVSPQSPEMVFVARRPPL